MLPDAKSIVLCIKAYRKVSHFWNSSLRQNNLATQLQDLSSIFVHRRDIDIVDDWLLRILSFHHTPTHRFLSAGCNKPVIHAGYFLNLPAEKL